MISSIMNIINSSLSACSNLFFSIFTGSGMVEIYIAIIFIILAFKFILSPIFGKSRGSDKARGASDE